MKLWGIFCRLLEREEWLEDPRFETGPGRSEHRDALNAALEARLVQFTTEEIVERLNAAGVPSGPILDVGQVFENEQVKHLGLTAMVRSPALGEIEIQGIPYRMSRTPGDVRRPAPERGEHSDAILAELGHSADDIRRLREARVI